MVLLSPGVLGLCMLFTLPAASAIADSPPDGPDGVSLQILDLSHEVQGELQVPVTLGNETMLLLLHPHSMQGPQFRVLVQDDSGSLQLVAAPSSITYRGTIAGAPASIVAGSVEDGCLRAFVRLDPLLPAWSIEPARSDSGGLVKGLHAIKQLGGPGSRSVACAVEDGPMHGAGMGAPSLADTVHTCEIAVDADHDYYTAHGSSTTTTVNEITSILNAVDAIYTADVSVTYSIGTIIVRTSSSDPYSTTSFGPLMMQFRHEWNANQCSVDRDVAQLFKGSSSGLQDGLAVGSSVCTLDKAYSVIMPDHFSTLADRTVLSAHELGHNWGASHCNSGACSSTCGIMCATLGGCPGSLSSFDACSIGLITSTVGSVTCLDATTSYPDIAISSVCLDQHFPCGGHVTTILPVPKIVLTGFGVSGTTQVTVGGSLVLTGSNFSIHYQDPSVSGNDPTDYVSFACPLPPALGVNDVTVANSCVTSSPSSLEFVEPAAPILVAASTGFSSSTFDWKFAGKAGHTYYLLVASSPASTYQQGVWPIMSGASILDLGTLDSIGYGDYSLTIPPGYAGLYFDSQIVTWLSGTGVTGSSPIITSHILF